MNSSSQKASRVEIARWGGMERQQATLKLRLGRFRARATLEMTPRGIAAIGACVSMILLGSAAIVAAARDPRRISPR